MKMKIGQMWIFNSPAEQFQFNQYFQSQNTYVAYNHMLL
jgi:hypothetical protein